MSLNDPTNPKNWESKLKPGIKFINTNEFSVYKEELKKIKNEVNNLDK